MPSILLVRHAQASFGGENYDVLSDHGAVQTKALVADLKEREVAIDRIVSGSLERQKDTAGPIAEMLGLDLAIDARWDEYVTRDILTHHSDEQVSEERQPRDDAPPVSSRDFQAILERALHAWIEAGEGGPADEPYTAFAGRVEAALRELAENLGSGETALVCTSGGPISAACSALLRVPAATFVSFNRVTINTGVTKIVHGRGGTSLVSFNEHAHLAAEDVTYR
ncbi:MAG TPA: histidine phosphatase family protein [Solirubrobacteraceae bacterium]|jgi:broad specificity phosphatase PhoE